MPVNNYTSRCVKRWHLTLTSSSSAPVSEQPSPQADAILNDPAHASMLCWDQDYGAEGGAQCTEPCLPWLTCPVSPIRWRMIDGCSKDARVVLWWVGSHKMSEQTKSSLCDNWGDYASLLHWWYVLYMEYVLYGEDTSTQMHRECW